MHHWVVAEGQDRERLPVEFRLEARRKHLGPQLICLVPRTQSVGVMHVLHESERVVRADLDGTTIAR